MRSEQHERYRVLAQDLDAIKGARVARSMHLRDLLRQFMTFLASCLPGGRDINHPAASDHPQPRQPIMHTRYVVAVVALILVGGAMKLAQPESVHAQPADGQQVRLSGRVVADGVVTASDQQTRDALNQQPEYPPKAEGLETYAKAASRSAGPNATSAR